MLMTIPDLLNTQQLEEIRALLGDASFVDGRLSAGRDAQRVKNNEEMASDNALNVKLNQLVLGRLYQHPTFQAAAMPLKLSSAFFARYGAGQSYGQHVDDAIMGPQGGQYRTDVSMTVFLSGPEDYEGGELTVETEHGEQHVKLPAGHAVFYPSGSLHSVAEVTSGQRLVAVAWAQSMVRDPQQRALLYDMYIVKEALQNVSPDAEATARANRSYINLVRLWSEL
ncbi:MAG: Fe2+-dependent dioxygenase [Gammaproteobacteria bacterium]|nr:Fe2+-dependent dioxygenase [Gammaproteobacteria bacterium]